MNKKIIGIILLGVSLTVLRAGAEQSNAHVRFFIDVPGKTALNLRKMSGWLHAHHFDVAGVDFAEGKIEVITSDRGVSFLKTNGMRGIEVKAPITGAFKATESAPSLDSRYYNPEKIEQKLKTLHEQYPQLTSVVQIGKSLLNRPIYALVVSTTPNLDDAKFFEKPSYLFDAMHHAREIMTPEVAIDIGESLLAAATQGVAKARATLINANIVIIPMVNVDGNAIVWSSDNMWRKNAHSEGGNTFGVDINRNYPYKFASCNGSSDNQSAQDYHGTSGASEPETQALMSIAQKIRPMASISYHSYSELVLYPYGCQGDYTGDQELISKLGHAMASLLPSDRGRGNYTAGTSWEVLYAVDGDSMSYLYSTYGAVSYVFEINKSFQPDYSLRDPTVKKHQAAWHYFLDQTQQHLLTVKVRDATGKSVQASMNLLQIPHIKGERDFGTNQGGNFFKVLLPGTYSLEVKSKDGSKKSVIPVSMTDQPQTVTVTL